MKHLDLFSGIGGFALAAETVWPDIEHIFCDNNPFCQNVLKKHWPNAKIYGDIRTLTADTEQQRSHNEKDKQILEEQRRDKLGLEQSRNLGQIDLLTGGFPCQPFSQAGRRKGTADDRYLWPEMLRVIREFHPRWVIGENVGGLITWNNGMVIEQVCADLEAEDYEVQTFVIPAVSVNAPHRRDRVWIVANSKNERMERNLWQESGITKFNRPNQSDASNAQSEGQLRKGQQEDATTADRTEQGCGLSDQNSNASNATSERSGGCASEKCGIQERKLESDKQEGRAFRSEGQGCTGEYAGNSHDTGLEGYGKNGKHTDQRSAWSPDWERNWLEVATELCRVDDGLPKRMARLPDGTCISQSKWRQEALKGFGNAIVPQVAIEIMRAIRSANGSGRKPKIPPTNL